jgi:hypothetical protein
MVIKVLDIIETPNAILQKFGWQVYDFLSDKIENGQTIELSFEGLSNLTSSFCNASIGKLYTQYGETLEEKFKIIGITDEYWQERIEESKLLALNPEKAKELSHIVADLFD